MGVPLRYFLFETTHALAFPMPFLISLSFYFLKARAVFSCCPTQDERGQIIPEGMCDSDGWGPSPSKLTCCGSLQIPVPTLSSFFLCSSMVTNNCVMVWKPKTTIAVLKFRPLPCVANLEKMWLNQQSLRLLTSLMFRSKNKSHLCFCNRINLPLT